MKTTQNRARAVQGNNGNGEKKIKRNGVLIAVLLLIVVPLAILLVIGFQIITKGNANHFIPQAAQSAAPTQGASR